jgi:hypothetical protein
VSFELRAKLSGYCWITADGEHLLHGDDLDGALELQPHFVQAMLRHGGDK